MLRCPRALLLLGSALVLACAGGCPDRLKGTVSGAVTLDGQPLAEGEIRFIPADGKSQPADARIVKGRYLARGVPVGEKRVEISAPKVVGKRKMYDTPDSPEVDDVAELLPERYNARSDLMLSVRSGSQTRDWALTSK